MANKKTDQSTGRPGKSKDDERKRDPAREGEESEHKESGDMEEGMEEDDSEKKMNDDDWD